MKMILLKFFGPSRELFLVLTLQISYESNFLHRVIVWYSDFTKKFTERNIVQNNDLQKTANLSACVMEDKEAFIL